MVPAFDGFRAYAVLGVVTVHVLIVSGFLPYNNGNVPASSRGGRSAR